MAARPQSDEFNGNGRMLQRASGPRHVREIIPAILWQLAITREAAGVKVLT
jgi:hypothetical protein